MQKDVKPLDMGGHQIYLGGKVNVRWHGVWYEGMVVKLGPREKLCRVRNVMANHTELLDPSLLKPKETHVLQKQFSPGTEVNYYSRTGWTQGVVESNTATGIAFVRWRHKALSDENETWFEAKDLAPVIENEAYTASNEDLLTAGKSGLIQNDMIEPRPRTVENVLYESDSEQGDAETDVPVLQRPHDSRRHAFQHQQSPQHITASPTYESIPTANAIDAPGHPLPEPPSQLPISYHHMARPTGMLHPMYTPFGQMWRNHNHSFSSALSPHPLHRIGLRKNLEQVSVPCVWSYSNQSNGIPPHRSSKFFKRLQRNFPKLNHHRLVQTHSVSTIKQSPSMVSGAYSEPTPYAERLFAQRPIPTRQVGKAKPSRTPFVAKSKGVEKLHSPKHNKQTVFPQPYEIPKPASKQPLTSLPLPPTPTAERIGERESNQVYSGAPEIVSASPSYLKVSAGSSVLLTCLADTRDFPTYEWFKDGKRIPDNAPNMAHSDPGMLQIQQASLNMSGEYSCIVTNENGSKKRTFRLEVTKESSAASERKKAPPSSIGPGFASKVTYAELNIEAPVTKSEPSEQYHSTEALKKPEPQTPNGQKPEVQKPEVQKPKVQKPEVQKPEVQKPEAPKLEAQKPEVQKPEVQKPKARKPEVQKPEVQKPEARKPEFPQKPEARKPEFPQKPEARKPEAPKLEAQKPEVQKPEARKPESPQMPETLQKTGSQSAQTPEAKMSEERIPESLQKPGPKQLKSKTSESPVDNKPSPREAARSVPHVTHWYPSPLHVYNTDEPDQSVSQDEQQESANARPPQSNQKLPADGTSTVRDNTGQESVEEKKASLPPIPRIVVTGEKKPKKRAVRRVSSVLKNDMEQYLEGYGEDYGALSSTTDLDLEGLHLYKPSEIKKSLTTKGEGSTQSKTSKEHRRKKEKKKSRKKKEKPPKNNPHFGKKGFNVSEDVNTGDDGVHSVAMVKTIAEPGDLIATQLQSQRDMGTETSQQDGREQEDADSVAVNTSLGSSGSESSLADVGESKGVSLPLEEETINDQVRRLQLSVETYSPESLGDGKGSHSKKKGFKSLFTSKPKAVAGTT